MSAVAQLQLNPRESVDDRINRRFAAFHQANPNVYDELVRLSRQAKAAGRERVGLRMLFEVVRWNQLTSTTGDQFKLNDNYISRYARLIMDQEPDLAGLYETRELRAAA